MLDIQDVLEKHKLISSILIENQVVKVPLPFKGIDKTNLPICKQFDLTKICPLGDNCPFRHIETPKSVVCKHWLRGLCKKGDNCEFLHEYNMEKMPECYFFAKFGSCSNKDCDFVHIDPSKKIKDCLWYDRGFCRHGSVCKNRHVRRLACINFLIGLCPKGPNCSLRHPKFNLPTNENQIDKKKVICNYCKEPGHKIYSCFKLPLEVRTQLQRQKEHSIAQFESMLAQQSNIEEVTCFKCNEKGHYSNTCPNFEQLKNSYINKMNKT